MSDVQKADLIDDERSDGQELPSPKVRYEPDLCVSRSGVLITTELVGWLVPNRYS